LLKNTIPRELTDQELSSFSPELCKFLTMELLSINAPDRPNISESHISDFCTAISSNETLPLIYQARAVVFSVNFFVTLFGSILNLPFICQRRTFIVRVFIYSTFSLTLLQLMPFLSYSIPALDSKVDCRLLYVVGAMGSGVCFATLAVLSCANLLCIFRSSKFLGKSHCCFSRCLNAWFVLLAFGFPIPLLFLPFLNLLIGFDLMPIYFGISLILLFALMDKLAKSSQAHSLDEQTTSVFLAKLMVAMAFILTMYGLILIGNGFFNIVAGQSVLALELYLPILLSFFPLIGFVYLCCSSHYRKNVGLEGKGNLAEENVEDQIYM